MKNIENRRILSKNEVIVLNNNICSGVNISEVYVSLIKDDYSSELEPQH